MAESNNGQKKKKLKNFSGCQVQLCVTVGQLIDIFSCCAKWHRPWAKKIIVYSRGEIVSVKARLFFLTRTHLPQNFLEIVFKSLQGSERAAEGLGQFKV